MEVITLRNLSSFGDVAAEDDAILDYFLSTEAAKKLETRESFLVLGRKGSGKTALVRHFSESGTFGLARSLNLRGYPWNVHAQRIDAGASQIEAYVASWRYLICVELSALLLSAGYAKASSESKVLTQFLNDNYGGVSPDLGVLLRPKELKLSKASFEPTVLGNKLGSVSLERSPKDTNFGIELDALSKSILGNVVSLAERIGVDALSLHIDELDHGLAHLDDSKRLMLVGLILAVRSLRIETRGSRASINPVIYLRSDLWEELDFSDKNKISQTHTVNIEWNEHSLKALVDERVSARIASRANWDDIIDSDLMRGSQPKWNHILARTFLRPRDVIKYLNEALYEAKARNDNPLLYKNKDIVDAREAYSSYLKKELDDEILPHWPYWEEALQACSAISTITFEKSAFISEYNARRSERNETGIDEALELLYSFSVIGYERRSGYGGSSWAFHYSDPQAGWDRSATRFKVHLGLKEYAKLREERAK
ncbi:P-loop ATPase, Sll1717 family [Pseudoxanthomonas beigongshangi]